MIEIILVIGIIGILIAGITIYIGGFDEKKAEIEAQGCASTIGGRISNYVFFALTSKNIKPEDLNTTISPNFYTIGLSGGNSTEAQPCNAINASGDNILCDKLIFGYSTGTIGDIELYKEITVRNTCRQNQPNLRFFWTGGNNGGGVGINNVIMNKGFTTLNLNNSNTFYLDGGGLVGDIIIVLCNDGSCSLKKEIAKRIVDGRSQTISQHNCAFYEDDLLKCKEREN